jgi:hypothetical protein
MNSPFPVPIQVLALVEKMGSCGIGKLSRAAGLEVRRVERIVVRQVDVYGYCEADRVRRQVRGPIKITEKGRQRLREAGSH